MHRNRMQEFDATIRGPHKMSDGDHIMRALEEKAILVKCGFAPSECILIYFNGIPYITIKRSGHRVRRK